VVVEDLIQVQLLLVDLVVEEDGQETLPQQLRDLETLHQLLRHKVILVVQELV
jgi:hypothetical protein